MKKEFYQKVKEVIRTFFYYESRILNTGFQAGKTHFTDHRQKRIKKNGKQETGRS